MKITIIGPVHPYRGGIAKFNEVLYENLQTLGYDTKVINFSLQYPSILFPGTSQYTTDPTPEGLESVRLVNSINPLSWGKVIREAVREKPDLVVMRYWIPFLAPALGYIARGIRKRGIKVVAITDNVIPHEQHFYEKPLTKYFLNSIDGALYMSHQVGDELKQYNFRGKTAMAPHPVYDNYGERVDSSEAKQHLGLDPQKRYLLFFGFIREYKGLDILIEALAKVIKNGSGKFDDLMLLVGGEFYSNREKYIKLIEDLGLQERIALHDNYLAQDEVRYYFSASDVVVQPYRSATQSGITQVAYHFLTPMIVTNVGGLKEIVPDGKVGYVVGNEGDSEQQMIGGIAQAIERFYENPDNKSTFGKNIATEKLRFSWENLIEKLLSL